MRFGLILLLLVSPQTARAQEADSEAQEPPPPALAPPLVQAPSALEPPPLNLDSSTRYMLVLEPGERLRVETAGGESQSGELVSLMPGALSLQTSPEQVVNFLVTDVQRLETRKRSPGYGALIGGGSGAALGALSFAFLCVLASEGDDGGAGGCALAGGLVVGALGAGVGTLLGLAVPRWATLYDKEEQGPLALSLKEPSGDGSSHWFSGRGPVGEVGLQLGYGRDMGIAQPTQGWGGRLHLLALVGPYFAVGPEVAWYSHIGTEAFVSRSGPPFVDHRSLFQLGALVRAGVQIGPTRTSALLGLGLHDNRTSHVGASAGGEVELELGKSAPPLVLDVRYHLPVGRDDFEPVGRFLTFGVGSRVRW